MFRRFGQLAVSVFTLAILAFVASPSTTFAGEPKTHDGFFLRLSTGLGSANTEIDHPLMSADIDGLATDVNIAIGGMVSRNFALHATLWGWSSSDPDADITIPGVGTASGSLDGSVNVGAFGGGATYYFMPVNIYLSGSVGMGTLSVDGGNADGESDSGIVTDLTLGKEWWVGDSWGLGLAGGFSYHSLPDGGIDENWSGMSYTARFSATLN